MADYGSLLAHHVKGEYIQGWGGVGRSWRNLKKWSGKPRPLSAKLLPMVLGHIYSPSGVALPYWGRCVEIRWVSPWAQLINHTSSRTVGYFSN